jgi:chromosome segregation ATPase
MVKKIVLGSVAALAVGTFVFGGVRGVWSAVRTGAERVRTAVQDEVPLEFQIDQAHQMVEDLGPEIDRLKRVIAEEAVELRNLRDSIDDRTEGMASQEEAILRLSADLQSGQERLVYSGVNYTVSQVQRDLTERFNRFQVAEDTLNREQEILSAREQAHASHRQMLEEMLSARADLEVEIERLQARLRSVEAAESICKIEIDDSQLAQCRSRLDEIAVALDVRETMLDEQGEFVGLIPLESEQAESAPIDIAEQVEHYFQGRDVETVMVSQEIVLDN